MATGLPDTATQVEDRIKADVQRTAPDSNPYLTVHWLRSLIAGIARRIFDFYLDLSRTEERLFPDTADDETAPRWGGIYVGPQNAATQADGLIVGTGVAGTGIVAPGDKLTAGGKVYTVTTGGTVAVQSLPVSSITRSGALATATTAAEHNLGTGVPVTISGAVEGEYNVTDAAIVVTGLTTFTYTVEGTPSTPATGTILAGATTVAVPVSSDDFDAQTNLDAGTQLTLQSPLVDVDDTFFVTFGAVGGGTDLENITDYKTRYLGKIRNPVAHFNESDIAAAAKRVAGVTRVFVEPAGTAIGSVVLVTLTRDGNIAKAVTATGHGLEDGARTSVTNADQGEYNVTDAPILVEDSTTFYYLVAGSPATPATGTVTANTVLALGQVRTFFMRDNDDDPIPTASEVQDVKDALDTIKPAVTSSGNNIVSAPTANPVAFTFTALSPDTATMRNAVTANLGQFFDEETTVSVGVTAKQYNAAIQNTVDPDTGDKLQTFTLSAPVGDIAGAPGVIPTLGAVAYP